MMKLNRTLIAVIVAISAFITACKKGDDSTGIRQTTTVNLVNATVDTVNVYVNGSRVNTTNFLYPLGSSGPINTLVGLQNYQARKAGRPDVLFNVPLALDSGKRYSFYIAGNSAEQAFAFVDTLSSAAKDTLLVRVAHTSPSVGNVDVTVGDTLAFTNISFKSISPYFATGSGSRRHIRIYKAGIAHSAASLISDDIWLLTPRRAYTIFLRSNLTTSPTTNATGLTLNDN
ncbi:DUF4397 domain-containing protein [Mucilaginibacter achroorhodeus]|uniref:DUF4397 domain-containing protein n=1 Tax=Mucilaginibacter achroorhodeus TaxID=2599294 RepID=A0A563U8R6_9SPHI|nr:MULTISPECIES: DUF4397 domain-containing protein [Mucilaginibacter]QXV67275.1 DUF4397 domain-containing protein [Mucilaginibacter sp. 21P]TWR27757.1 DUF4397 domain-containing protein [Mucilaginibacter achroorhodeus]